MDRTALSLRLRRLGLLEAFDRLRYRALQLRLRRRNAAFLAAHPGLALPPPYLVYESYAMDYEAYWRDGLDTARWVAGLLRPHVDLEGGALLDWGCGPARVVRHMPSVLEGLRCAIHGSDYNPGTVAWCRASIPGAAFSLNSLAPPLAYPDRTFTALYGISVLTHLSGEMHREWLRELARVLKPGGAALLTTHGRVFRPRLSSGEAARYDRGELVERGRVKEGHRTFTAYHPEAFMRTLFADAGFEVAEHREGSLVPGEFAQDVWIARKPAGLSPAG